MAGLICAGDVYIALYNTDGSVAPAFPPVNATKMAISAQGAEKKERKSKMRATYGQVLDSVADPQPHEVAISLDDFSGEILAMAFSGESYAVAQTAATGETATIDMDSGNWVQLNAHRHVSNVVITSSTEGTDFEVNARLGMVRAIAGGNLEAATSQLVTYDIGDVTGSGVKGATVSQINAKIVLDGTNLADNSDIIVTIDKATITADGEVDFLADEYPGVDLGGTCVTLDGKDHPYTVEFPVNA